MTPAEICDYEVRASWWASYVGWGWGRWLASRYFAWKVRRKWRRYAASVAAATRLRAGQPQPGSVA